MPAPTKRTGIHPVEAVMTSCHRVFRLAPLALATTLAASLYALPAAQAAPRQNSDASTSARPTQDTSTALVQLNGDPLSTYVKTKPPQGKKIDFNSNTVKSY